MTVSPLAIDMYLPAFLKISLDIGTTPALLSLTMSSYFFGIAVSQLFYGPVLDRFGRTKPLYWGLAIYILACIGCMEAKSLEWLIVFRFVQALGGCVAGVAAIAMVRDFFPAKEAAKIIALLFLVLAISPLLAPSVGTLISATLGWRWIFGLLAVVVLGVAFLVRFFLPKGAAPDRSVSMKLGSMVRTYIAISKDTEFLPYALAGALSFAALFLFVGGAPIIYLQGFHLSQTQFAGFFAFVTFGFIASSQINILLLRVATSRRILQFALTGQVVCSTLFLVGALLGWWGLLGTTILFFLILSCIGVGFPNASALALTRFDENVGSASALISFLQIGIAGVILACLAVFNSAGIITTIILTFVSSLLALGVLFLRKRQTLE